MRPAHRRWWDVALAAAALTLAACGPDRPPSLPPEPTPPAVTAADVVAAFAAAGLPAENPRDNSVQCADEDGPWCAELVTTDDIGVYRFTNETTARNMAEVNPTGHRVGLFLLDYASAATPEDLRPRYEEVAAETVSP